ncbi:hypothetical protein ACFQ4L_01130 [Lapidilactobacillus mulanensis]|uniref:Uncharacterized protein n=1 Tax=Lapidilactobacillus mulanensis TaxID=2485999 RepID=A0ABW4DP53_9LACO|nr:hypothetical protein [Lapidilactobacillus mulanensis]
MPFILFLFFIPILLIIVFALIAGAIGIFFGLLKFLLPLIIIAAIVNYFARRSDRSDSWTTRSTYQRHPTSSSSQHIRKEIYDVKEKDVSKRQHDDHDEWSDF